MENMSTTVETYAASTDTTNSSVDPYYIDFSPYYAVLNTVYYAVLGPVAIIGNLLAIAVSHRILRYRKSIPDMMTGTLAACDLLCVISAHTPAVISMAEGQWTGGIYVCSFQYFMAWSCLKTSFFIIILMTVDRYLALVKPFYYRAKVTLRQMKIALFTLTFFSFASTSITIIWFSSEITLLPNWYLCMNTWGKGNQYYSYILALYGLTFVVGVIIFNVCNTGIVFSLMRHNRKSQQMKLRALSTAQDRQERRVAKVIETLSVVFMLFWVPYLVFIVLHQTKIIYSEFAEDLAIRILFANTLLNPVIYGLFNRTYRKAYVYYARKLLYLALCGKIKKPEERRIFYLRKSNLQHHYARKTHSHGRGRKDTTTDLPTELGQEMKGNPLQHAGHVGILAGDVNPTDSPTNLSLNEFHELALDNIGFILNTEENLTDSHKDSITNELDICTISHREDVAIHLNGGSINQKNICTVGQGNYLENGPFSKGETVVANTNVLESTWI